MVGLSVTAPGGREWKLEPQFGDLSEAEGGFTTPLGKFTAKWQLKSGGYTLVWGAPPGTKGNVVLPGRDGRSARSVVVDGKERIVRAADVDGTAGTVKMVVGGGEHKVEVVY